MHIQHTQATKEVTSVPRTHTKAINTGPKTIPNVYTVYKTNTNILSLAILFFFLVFSRPTHAHTHLILSLHTALLQFSVLQMIIVDIDLKSSPHSNI